MTDDEIATARALCEEARKHHSVAGRDRDTDTGRLVLVVLPAALAEVERLREVIAECAIEQGRGLADMGHKLAIVRKRAEIAELVLAQQAGVAYVPAPSTARLSAALDAQGAELETLTDDIDEHLPQYVLDDGTDEPANERERIEHAGAEIVRLRAEVERLTVCLFRANANAEKHERLRYLATDFGDVARAEIDRLRAALIEACRLLECATNELAEHEDDPSMMDGHRVRIAELRAIAEGEP